MDNFNLQPRGASPHLGGSLLTEPPSSSAITMGDETGPSSQTPRHAPNLSHRLNPPREAINRLIMNYLVTEGFKEAAEKFQNEANVSLPDDVGDMDNRIKIRNAIQTGQIRDAILIVHQLYPELLDDDRYLFFHLQQQQLIELIRESRVEEALKFASEQLAERGEEDPAILEELERTMALLAFENPEQSPFANLLSASHRQKVASELNAALLKAENAEYSQPKLAGLLKLLLWSQKELGKKGVAYKRVLDFDPSDPMEISLMPKTRNSQPHPPPPPQQLDYQGHLIDQ